MPISDTSSKAREIQLRIHREMSAERRFLLACEMSDLAREIARSGIRRAHPEWTDSQVNRELLRITFLPAPMPTSLR